MPSRSPLCRHATARCLAFVVVSAMLPVATPAFALSGMAMKALCSGRSPAQANATQVAAAARDKATGDAAFKLRADPAKLAEALKAYKSSLAANARQADVQLNVSRLNYLLADGKYRFDEDDEKQLAAFQTGAAHAAAAVALTAPRFRELICSGATIDEAVGALDAGGIPAMYWFATHLGKYGLAKDLLEVLANKDMIFAVMTAARRLVPDYFYGAPDRYLAAYYTKVPFPKGDLPRALSHFQASMRRDRDYFATYVLVAQMYALKIKALVPTDARYCKLDSAKADKPGEHPCRRMYRRLLKHVIDADPTVIPAIAAEQRVEQQKAKALLEELDTYFGA